MKKMLFAGLILAGMTLSACNIGGGINIGRDGKAVSTLSEDDKQAACDEIEEYTNSQISEEDQKRYACTIGGIIAASFGGASTDAELREACAMTRDECIAAPAQESDDGSSCSLDGIPDDCEATIGELETCYEELIDLQAQAVAETQCETLSVEASSDGGGDEDTTPESCKTLEEKCPSMMPAS